MEGTTLDGSAEAITAVLERKKTEIDALISGRHADASFREGLREGVRNYCAVSALHDLCLAQLKRDYAQGTRGHIRDVHRFLSSPESEDEFALRDMLNFVLGLLDCYVSLLERQADTQVTSALSNLDAKDLTHV
jgi:hypothetical protein